jgi:uncharacterized membrane protein YdbT with pleckstrin-like domain
VELVTPSRRHALPVAVVVAEVVAALLLVGLAWWCWHRGVIVTVRRGVAMNRVEGRWWALATGEVTFAGLVLLDAARRVTSEPSQLHGG